MSQQHTRGHLPSWAHDGEEPAGPGVMSFPHDDDFEEHGPSGGGINFFKRFSSDWNKEEDDEHHGNWFTNLLKHKNNNSSQQLPPEHQSLRPMESTRYDEPPRQILVKQKKENSSRVSIFGTRKTSVMDEDEDYELDPTEASELLAKGKPRKNPCLHCLHLFEIIVILALLLLLASQVIPIFYMTLEDLGHVQLALRAYLILFCLVFVLVEARTPINFLQASVLGAFFSRGFIYTFLGVICLEQAYCTYLRGEVLQQKSLSGSSDGASWVSDFTDATAYIIIGIGATYMLFGCFCVGSVKRNLERKHQERLGRYERAGGK